MPAPRVKPLNPDHQQLIDSLLADPTKAMCPICGERGFWDNRGSKPSETSPDFKCRNKSCVGATPMKRKSPYAVWLPEGYATAPATPSRRLAGPASHAEAAPDGPPAFHRDIPLPESPEGELVAAAAEAVVQFGSKQQALIDGYLGLYAMVAERLVDIGRSHDFPVDGASINAATATIAIQLDKRNLL